MALTEREQRRLIRLVIIIVLLVVVAGIIGEGCEALAEFGGDGEGVEMEDDD